MHGFKELQMIIQSFSNQLGYIYLPVALFLCPLYLLMNSAPELKHE